MNEILTERQLYILKAIIEEYIETAEPVGSETLDKKYNLGISPATIRNEMVRLTQSGYLKQNHTSAGRTPTSLALKLYVDKLLKQKELPLSDEVVVKQKIWDYRAEMDKFLKEAVKTLAEKTGVLSIAATDEGDIYVSGMGNILQMPEFYDIDVTKNLLDTLDEYDYWWSVLSSHVSDEDILSVLLADQIGKKLQNYCGGVFAHFSSLSEHHGSIGVVGPSRLNYSRVIPLVRYMGNIINDVARSW
jgi:heat-inducible transcriptional repressor